MWKYTLKVTGMMCGMCEAHINDAIRKVFHVKKVTSSHGKNQTVILADMELDENLLRSTIAELGYDVENISKEPWKKKGLFKIFS